jgi:DNA helicase-4
MTPDNQNSMDAEMLDGLHKSYSSVFDIFGLTVWGQDVEGQIVDVDAGSTKFVVQFPKYGRVAWDAYYFKIDGKRLEDYLTERGIKLNNSHTWVILSRYALEYRRKTRKIFSEFVSQARWREAKNEAERLMLTAADIEESVIEQFDASIHSEAGSDSDFWIHALYKAWANAPSTDGRLLLCSKIAAVLAIKLPVDRLAHTIATLKLMTGWVPDSLYPLRALDSVPHELLSNAVLPNSSRSADVIRALDSIWLEYVEPSCKQLRDELRELISQSRNADADLLASQHRSLMSAEWLSMERDRIQLGFRDSVIQLLEKYDYDGADLCYQTNCAQWWSNASYNAEKRRYEMREQDFHRGEVRSHLERYNYELAENYFIARCAAWWGRDSFQELKAQYEKREWDAVASLKELLARLIGCGEFNRAKEEYAKATPRLLPVPEFEAFFQEHRLLYEQKRRRESLQASIRLHLASYRFEEARQSYESNQCAEWWPVEDYESEEIRQNERGQRLVHELKNSMEHFLERRDYGRAITTYIESRLGALWPEESMHAFVEVFRCKHFEEDRFVDTFSNFVGQACLAKLDALYASRSSDLPLSIREYVSLKLVAVRTKLSQIRIVLDDEQLSAVARPESRTLVRARAGSGKTRTLCARSAVAIHDESLDPDQVLMVAFNKSAADEVRKRMRTDFGCPAFENARTFHSLAYQLAKPKKPLLFDEGRHPSQRAQSGFVQSLLERILNPAFKELLYQFFRKEIEEVERLGRDLAPDEHRAFRRSLEQVSLKGGRVNSSGEKYIADFLFEHDIPYTYEKIWEWGTFEQGQPYKPDFTLVANGSDFILEHWAIDPRDRSAHLPDEWGMTADQYRQQIARKRMFWAEKNITLLETHCGELASGREAFELTLKKRLEDAGIRCQKLPDEEIIRRVFENNFQISRMAEQFLQFIQRAKKRCLSVDGVGELIAERRTLDQRLHLFYQLALRVYREYESELAERGSMDFDDLLRQATEEVIRQGADARIHLGEGRFVKIGDLRWLLVDEYQDFSELYYRLLSAILDANPKIRLMAVGDDWQAINGFAGAELRFFTDFAQYFPGAGEATIATNYRSARSLVTWGNRLMSGLGPEARPRDGALTGETKVVDLGKEWIEFRSGPQYEEDRKRDAIYFGDIPEGTNPGMAAQRMARALKICVRLFHQTKTGKLLLLSRTKRAYGLELGDFRNRLVGVLATITGEDRQILRKKIRVMTAHTAKGQEEEAVVVLDASQTNFPKVHPDNLLYEIFGVTPAEVLAEEQRLFYVAITRPAETLWILTEGDTSSLYIKKLMQPALSDRAFNATPSSVPAEPSALYKRIKERIEALPSVAHVPATKEASVSDPWSDVVEDVVDGLKPVVQKMRTIEGTPIPKVAFDLDDSGEFVGELAWPDQVPPLVVLAGEQSEHRERWELEGWMVLADGVAIRQGGAWLADQLTLLGELPPEKPHSPQRISGSVSSVESARGSGTIFSRIAGLFYSIGDIPPSSILSVGDELDLIREPDNRHDSFAVKIVLEGRKLGYVPSAHSRTVARLIDNHHSMVAVVSKVGASDVEIEVRDR